MHGRTRNTFAVLFWGPTLLSNCVHGSFLTSTTSARDGDSLDLKGLGVDDQKQWYARTIVLESSNREESKIGWFIYVLKNQVNSEN